MKKLPKRVVTVNIFGTVGYICALVSWALLAAIFFVLLANSSFMTMPHQTTVTTLPLPANPSSNAPIVGYGVVGLAALIVFCVFVTLPYFISRGLSRFLRTTSTALRMSQTKQHMWLLKAVMTVIPSLGFSIITVLGARGDDIVPIFTLVFFVSLLSFGLFSFQYLIAWRLRVPSKSIW